MNATELYRSGRLQAALEAQIQDVKSHPADHGKRLFLFELAVFSGDLERARRQIDALQYEAPELETSRLAYLRLLDSEEKRRRLFRESLPPRFLADPPEHVRLRLEALGSIRGGKLAEASGILARANEAVPSLTGTLNNKAFTDIRDADDRFATVLEVLAQGAYFWVPLEQVDSLAMNPPKTPRDLIWTPARLTMREGEQGEVFLPMLYPGTQESTDEKLKLGQATDWQDLPGGAVLGVGLRTFLVGEDGLPLIEWRELVLH